jgi:hypothetical protein
MQCDEKVYRIYLAQNKIVFAHMSPVKHYKDVSHEGRPMIFEGTFKDNLPSLLAEHCMALRARCVDQDYYLKDLWGDPNAY